MKKNIIFLKMMTLLILILGIDHMYFPNDVNIP